MKILLTTEFCLDFVCGVTTAVLNQKNILEKLGNEVRILTISPGKRSNYCNGVYNIRRNLPSFYKDSFATLALNDSLVLDIIEWKPEIVHANNEFFSFIFAKKISRKCNTPLFLTCHTDFASYGIYFTKNKKLWNYLITTIIPKLLKPANALLCSSSKINLILRDIHVSNPILNIKLGIDLRRFNKQLLATEKEALKTKLSLPKDSIVFLSACRLTKEKAVDQCITMFSHICKTKSNVCLLIVGDGPEVENLHQLVEKYGIVNNVVFTGLVPYDEIWKYYLLGDVFINASVSETQGLTFIEALASSVPVICKKDEVIKNFLKDGFNGYSYVSEEEFLERCLLLIEDGELLKSLKNNAAKSVEDFGLDKYGGNLMKLYTIALDEQWRVNRKIPENSIIKEAYYYDNI